MSKNLSFEEMLEDSLVTIRNGEVVEGTVMPRLAKELRSMELKSSAVCIK